MMRPQACCTIASRPIKPPLSVDLSSWKRFVTTESHASFVFQNLVVRNSKHSEIFCYQRSCQYAPNQSRTLHCFR